MATQAEQIIDSCSAYLIGPDFPEATARPLGLGLVELYNQRERYHHNLNHLVDVVDFLLEVSDDLQQPRPTFWAANGHDSIYLPKNTGDMNERLSGALTSGLILPYLPIGEVQLVDYYIQKTADHQWDGKDPDLAYFLDADMKILGAPPDEFDEYDDNIRREYELFDDVIYRPGRAAVLKTFYDNPRLFITDVAHERFDAQAKANLERKISELTA